MEQKREFHSPQPYIIQPHPYADKSHNRYVNFSNLFPQSNLTLNRRQQIALLGGTANFMPPWAEAGLLTEHFKLNYLTIILHRIIIPKLNPSKTMQMKTFGI